MNKIFVILISCICLFQLNTDSVFAKPKIPRPIGYVNDFANVLSPATENTINSLSKELKAKTTSEVVVVTLKSLDDYPIEDWALNIGREWKVGAKGKNNGVIILVAPYDKKLRIEVGYGIEQFITDAHAGRIRDKYMVPYFKAKDYEKGTLYGSAAVIEAIAKGYGVAISGNVVSHSNAPIRTKDENPVANLIFMVILIALAIRYPRQAFFIMLLLSSGSRGGGRSSGGFGGFSGGGGFGGGGASGRW